MRHGRESEATEAVFCLKEKSPLFYRGAYRVPLFNQSVCPSVSVCVPFVVFTDCESCARPISSNPGSMEAGEYGLTRGTCLIARRLEVVAVAGLSWCFGMRRKFVFFPFFFSWNAQAALPQLPLYQYLYVFRPIRIWQIANTPMNNSRQSGTGRKYYARL